MNYCVCEEFNSRDVIQAIMQDELSHEQINQLTYLLGFSEYLHEFAPMTAERMIFVHSKADYNFTSKDLNWLAFTSEVLRGKTETGINIFAFRMSCLPDDYYIPCAAMIKIFNIAFPEDNLFVFHVDQKLAIGCKRTFFSAPPNNFCISALFGEDALDNIEELFEELSYATSIADFPLTVLAFSPQESVASKPIDQSRFNPDYLLFLDEFQSMHGVDTSLERECYLASFSKEERHAISYREACDTLYDIAIGEEVSSLDILDAAMVAEEKAIQGRLIPSVKQNFDELTDEHISTGFSKEAFLDAEVMLTEMLKQTP